MRKKYLDNIRWFIILLVLIDHTVCIFSSCKSPMSYNTTGIEVLDSLGYMIYPWFMPCLFVVAGMSAKYALEKKDKMEFIYFYFFWGIIYFHMKGCKSFVKSMHFIF